MNRSKFHAAMLQVAETEPPVDAMTEPLLIRRLRVKYFKDSERFLDKLAELDRSHEANKARERLREKASLPAWDGKEPCPVCKRAPEEPAARDAGRERVEVAGRRYLDEVRANVKSRLMAQRGTEGSGGECRVPAGDAGLGAREQEPPESFDGDVSG